MSRLDAILDPAGWRPERLYGRAAAVIDVLRATTTVAVALARGARAVVPVAGVDEARAQAARLARREPVLLAGERGALPPPGFDLGNSPSALDPERMRGRTLVLCTTNGTRALARVRRAGAEPVFAAALVNAGAVAAALARELAAGRLAVLVCSGREGEPALEDALAAGCIAAAVTARWPDVELGDGARLAAQAWEAARADWPRALAEARHARDLATLGFVDDVALAGRVDAVPVLPRLARGRLVADAGG